MDCDIENSFAFQELISWDNLYHASQKSAKGKRSKLVVASFEYRLSQNLLELQAELVSGTYQPAGYVRFYLLEPKRRLISAAAFRDRVVHHALCNIIEPRFERLFSPRSFANRKGKGTHRAIELCKRNCQNYRFALRLDIRKHFESIDHHILKQCLFKHIPESEIRELIERILENGDLADGEAYLAMPGDDLLSRCRSRGLPIGNLTSQFWFNCYLHQIDQYLDRQSGCKAWIRYVDDFVLFSNSKKYLWRWKQEVMSRLEILRLLVHEESAQMFPTQCGVPWLGTIVNPSGCRIKSRKVRYSSKRLRRKAKESRQGKSTYSDLSRSVRAWRSYIEISERSAGLGKVVFSRMR